MNERGPGLESVAKGMLTGLPLPGAVSFVSMLLKSTQYLHVRTFFILVLLNYFLFSYYVFFEICS